MEVVFIGQEVGADEQENNLSNVEMIQKLRLPLGSWHNTSVVSAVKVARQLAPASANLNILCLGFISQGSTDLVIFSEGAWL